jgi:hypothetical protein
MFAKTLMVSTALAAGLLALDVCAPMLTGATAQAEAKNVTRSNSTGRTLSNTTRKITTTTKRIGTGIKTTTTTTINAVKGNARSFVNKNNTGTSTNKNTAAPLIKNNVGLANTGLIGKINKGPGVVKVGVVSPALGGTKFVNLGNKKWPIHASPYKIWWKGGWKTWLPFTAIGAVLIGGSYYWADSYVSVGRPYCTGITPDGCQLNWQHVGFEDGGGDYQCVQFCPRPSEPPPAQAVALVAPPPQSGACKLTIFAEAAFAGTNAPTTEDQPHLGEVGWKDQIASIQVENGTWDFFTEDDFHGESMRLAPGPYPQLTPDWNKHIGSFMCVQGS